ncbi:MAG: hypothetical protein OEY41_07360, partial [Acidimicrobiia bacterium]|nr:hypothetical protein [Acidimicrobiia bacterium]
MPTPPYPSSPSRRPGRALLAALLGAAALLAACASSAERAAVDITSDTIADSSATAFPIEIDTAGGPVTI